MMERSLRIDSPGVSATTECFDITCTERFEEFAFYGVIHHNHKDISSDIFVGGDHGGCFTLSVQSMSDQSDKKKGILHLEHDRRLNVYGDVEYGIELLRTAIGFTFARFPDVKSIIFKDVSTVPCGEHGDMPLAPMHIAECGQTWWELYMQATLLYDVNREAYSRAVEMCKEPLGPFNSYWNDHLPKQMMWPHPPNGQKVIKRGLRSFWKGPTTTLHDLVVAIKAARRCELFRYWLHKKLFAIEGLYYEIQREQFYMPDLSISASAVDRSPLLAKNKERMDLKDAFLDESDEEMGHFYTIRRGTWDPFHLFRRP